MASGVIFRPGCGLLFAAYLPPSSDTWIGLCACHSGLPFQADASVQHSLASLLLASWRGVFNQTSDMVGPSVFHAVEWGMSAAYPRSEHDAVRRVVDSLSQQKGLVSDAVGKDQDP